MKKTKFFISLAFVVFYAVFVSLMIECSLNMWGLSLAISLDGASVSEQFPRFIPFCILVEIFAVCAIAILFIFHSKLSGKLEYTKKDWWIQTLSAFIISIPMIKPWELLFEFLQKTF